MYRCFSCKKEVEIEDKVRCSYCGFRILVKARPEVVRRVKAV
ncbi:MAG: DNA-directed RNA polymerase subunit P [Candidatus Aenigmarchaeota archaeon]|nr:DNA-directed RNA polymerase subunit P [Candidatus Aenigmarchaeota archaeon]